MTPDIYLLTVYSVFGQVVSEMLREALIEFVSFNALAALERPLVTCDLGSGATVASLSMLNFDFQPEVKSNIIFFSHRQRGMIFFARIRFVPKMKLLRANIEP